MSSSRSRSQSTVRASLRQRSSERNSRLTKSNPGSRNQSPCTNNRRVAKLNMYLSRRSSSDQLHRPSTAGNAEPPEYASFKHTDIKRWDGNKRMTVKWNCIRKVVYNVFLYHFLFKLKLYQDHELWFTDEDCLVHFYERGQSRRGASLRVPRAIIEESNFGPSLDRYLTDAMPVTPSSSASDSTCSGYFDALHNLDESAIPAKYELHIPAPTHYGREEAFRYHLTTRNFFAWMFDRPVVGERLGDSLIDLYDRMNELRPDQQQNEDDLLTYIDGQGYTDFRDCCDHALAVLRFSEKLELRDLWTDAFAHCAGLWEKLDTSAEFPV